MTDRDDPQELQRSRDLYRSQWGPADQELPTGYRPDELARPVAEVAAVVDAARVEREHRGGGDRMRGILLAGQWLAGEWHGTPIYRESRYPLRAVILEELDMARRVAVDEDAKPDPRDTDVTSEYAQGVAEMLAYATDPDAQPPILLT